MPPPEQPEMTTKRFMGTHDAVLKGVGAPRWRMGRIRTERRRSRRRPDADSWVRILGAGRKPASSTHQTHLAVEAVIGEPVSLPRSLITGKIQGNFDAWERFWRCRPSNHQKNQRVACEFPKNQNRDFSRRNREFCNRKQGFCVSAHFSHMWNGPPGKDFFKRFITRERCSHMSGLSARLGPLASMKSAMRGADHTYALYALCEKRPVSLRDFVPMESSSVHAPRL